MAMERLENLSDAHDRRGRNMGGSLRNGLDKVVAWISR